MEIAGAQLRRQDPLALTTLKRVRMTVLVMWTAFTGGGHPRVIQKAVRSAMMEVRIKTLLEGSA